MFASLSRLDPKIELLSHKESSGIRIRMAVGAFLTLSRDTKTVPSSPTRVLHSLLTPTTCIEGLVMVSLDNPRFSSCEVKV